MGFEFGFRTEIKEAEKLKARRLKAEGSRLKAQRKN